METINLGSRCITPEKCRKLEIEVKELKQQLDYAIDWLAVIDQNICGKDFKKKSRDWFSRAIKDGIKNK